MLAFLRPGIWIERAFAFAGLILCSPVLAVAAAAILLEDGRPFLFEQRRAGRGNQLFSLWKLRSMRIQKAEGAQITSSGDVRITRVGAFLRKYKLDELPQLWNVCRGDMSLIGPRPEVPAYIVPGDAMWTKVLSLRPGITDLSTLVFRNEEQLLAASTDPEQYYRTVVLPQKLHLAWHYHQIRNLFSDSRLLLATVLCSFKPSSFEADQLKRTFLKANCDN